MSEIEIITDGGRRRRWSAAEKLRIVEEARDERTSISVVARRNGVAPNLLYRWRRLMLEGGSARVFTRKMYGLALEAADEWPILNRTVFIVFDQAAFAERRDRVCQSQITARVAKSIQSFPRTWPAM